jgi:hypothetical protein
MLIYVSGPYTSKDGIGIDANIQAAREIAIRCWEKGHAVICPHLNTAHFERDCTVDYKAYIAGDLNMVARCDALVMVDGWESSNGATIEADYAQKLSIPIYTADNIPELHSTEIRCPVQVEAFREVVGRMYRIHLDKNADYSPANIGGLGSYGVVNRLWDKVCRLLNLHGVDIHAEFKGISGERAAVIKDESVDDTYLDTANYGVIGFLLRKGKWGK